MDSSEKKVYLAGPWDVYSGYWKQQLKEALDFNWYDPEIDSDQSGYADKYFSDDIKNVIDSDMMILYPDHIPAEASFFEAGVFFATHNVGLIIVWPEDRKPPWAYPFLNQAATMVESIDEVINLLGGICNQPK